MNRRKLMMMTGAAALTSFVRGLHAHRPGAAVTLIGHSYGAIVVGLAAPRLREEIADEQEIVELDGQRSTTDGYDVTVHAIAPLQSA